MSSTVTAPGASQPSVRHNGGCVRKGLAARQEPGRRGVLRWLVNPLEECSLAHSNLNMEHYEPLKDKKIIENPKVESLPNCPFFGVLGVAALILGQVMTGYDRS